MAKLHALGARKDTHAALAAARGFLVQEIADAKVAKTRKSTKNLTEPKATCLANVESTR